MSPFDTFFSLERYKGESALHLFMRMIKIYQEIPSGIRPLGRELMDKLCELGIYHDSQLLVFLEKICEVLREEKNDDIEEEILDQVEEESIHDEMCMETCINDHEEEDLLSIEEISYLLDIEYQKH